MKISHKLSIILIASTFVLIIFANLLFQFFFSKLLIDQEKKQMLNNINNITSYFNEKKSRYKTVAEDWGHWDDTYEFCNLTNPDFPSRNLTKTDFITLNVNFIIIYSKTHSVVYKSYFDLNNKEFTAFPEHLIQDIDHAFSKENAIPNIIKFGQQYFIVAESDVTDSLRKKPENGTMIIGRVIDNDMIYDLSRQTGGEITVASLQDKTLFYPGNTANKTVVNKDDATITGYVLLNNSNKSSFPVLVLKREMRFFITGQSQISVLCGFFSAFIIIVLLFVLLLLNKYISKPIDTLTKRIEGINLDSEVFEKLPEFLGSELSVLSKTVNKMLSKILDERNYLKKSESRLSMAQMVAHVGSWELNLKTMKIHASEEAFRIHGIAPYVPELPFKTALRCIHPEYRSKVDQILEQLKKQKNLEVQYKIKRLNDSQERFLFLSSKLVLDKVSKVAVISGVVQDITESKKNEEIILYNSYHDSLTGLCNRRFFDDQLRKFETVNISPVSIIIGDVNDLKLVNDAFGHQMGDRLLRMVANVLKNTCRPNDILARWGGDEFLILLPNTGYEETEKIVNIISNKCSASKIGSIKISVSFGFDTKTDNQQNINSIIKFAEDKMYRIKLIETSSVRGKTIDTILHTLFEKNPREEKHSRRVSDLCFKIGKALGLKESDLNKLKVIGLVHDIGKIALNEEILNKTSLLTKSEWDEMKRHPEIGYRILNSTAAMSEIAQYILMHHERLDGSGYPKGLKDDDIPLMSRILAVADSYDAMISNRPYRESFTKEAALKELLLHSSTQLDADVVNCLIKIVKSNTRKKTQINV
ncbi:MAG: diguanylate cyclase [Clostridiales bacterium]|nr:diguanylate cyclase [Clostridiales bacterium]